MEYATVMNWSGGDWGIRSPVTVCRVAPVTIAADGIGDLKAFETEREAHELGYRWCVCFTVDCPDGERAHMQEPLLLPLAGAEFEAALYALRTGDDAVLDMWLSYRLNAVRHELLPPGALTRRDRALAPDSCSHLNVQLVRERRAPGNLLTGVPALDHVLSR